MFMECPRRIHGKFRHHSSEYQEDIPKTTESSNLLISSNTTTRVDDIFLKSLSKSSNLGSNRKLKIDNSLKKKNQFCGVLQYLRTKSSSSLSKPCSNHVYNSVLPLQFILTECHCLTEYLGTDMGQKLYGKSKAHRQLEEG